ncbi:hypothetical protein CL651_002705 [bacterium]|nr:hypothetical protein [bacterium]
MNNFGKGCLSILLILLFIFIFIKYNDSLIEKEEKKIFCKEVPEKYNISCNKNYRDYLYINSQLKDEVKARIKYNNVYNKKIDSINKKKILSKTDKTLYKEVKIDSQSDFIKIPSNTKIKFLSVISEGEYRDNENKNLYKIEITNINQFNLFVAMNYVVNKKKYADKRLHGEYFTDPDTNKLYLIKVKFNSILVEEKLRLMNDCMLLNKDIESLNKIIEDSDLKNCLAPFNINGAPLLETNFNYINWSRFNQIDTLVIGLVKEEEKEITNKILHISDLIFKEIVKTENQVLEDVLFNYINERHSNRNKPNHEDFLEYARYFYKNRI